MFEIDKKRFGAFGAALRKEKGYTQKELAEKLFISAKAVSKWETGISIPDTALLVPLAELLGVTVTELLLCRRAPEGEALDAAQVDEAVRTALTYQDQDTPRAYQTKSRWKLFYLLALLLGAIEAALCARLSIFAPTLWTTLILGAVFGAYFCLFVKTRLPAFYDENECSFYFDGILRMNLPGTRFSNRNWPKVILAGRVWSCAVVAGYPALVLVMGLLLPALWAKLELALCLTLCLGGLFVPLYVVGRKNR